MSPERIQFVRSYQHTLGLLLSDAYSTGSGIQTLRRFVEIIPDRVRSVSRELATRLVGNENALTEHADSLRSITDYIRDLSERILPGIEANPRDPVLRIEAAERASYIESHCKAMEFNVA